MSSYVALKTLHIVSSTILFGTGLGIAFFKWSIDRSGNITAIRVVSERVVLADWLFTTPAVIIQAVTGIALANLLGFPLTQGWVMQAVALYCLAGACWIPVVVLQIRMRELARAADRDGAALSEQYWRYARIWFWLGMPAFAAVLLVFWLMVTKPS